MTYPLASEVTAGQPTAATHYNNLLADAQRLGNSAADSILLGELLAGYQSGITLQYLDSNRIRIPASSAAPVRLVIGGAMPAAFTTVDLPPGQFSGGAATYYIFAVRSGGSSTFTLAVNTSPAESSDTRLLGSVEWDGSALANLQSKTRADILAHTGLNALYPCNGRLSLASGQAAPAGASGNMLYFVPYLGNVLALYEVGYGWRLRLFDELNLALAGLTVSKLHDIFACVSSDVPRLEAQAWSSDSARAVGLQNLNGVPVKAGDPTRRYLGTLRTTASAGCADNESQRLLWNLYNPQPRALARSMYTAHTYTNTSPRPWNNDTGFRFEVVQGLNTLPAWVSGFGTGHSGFGISVGLDSTSSGTTDSAVSNVATSIMSLTFSNRLNLSEGYHYLQMLESGGSSAYFYYAAMSGLVWA